MMREFVRSQKFTSTEDILAAMKTAYVVLGINLDGQKDILGIWIGENESRKFWLNVLNELKTRGIKDVFLFCVDGLTGFISGL